jgi:hypothetical protein
MPITTDPNGERLVGFTDKNGNYVTMTEKEYLKLSNNSAIGSVFDDNPKPKVSSFEEEISEKILNNKKILEKEEQELKKITKRMSLINKELKSLDPNEPAFLEKAQEYINENRKLGKKAKTKQQNYRKLLNQYKKIINTKSVIGISEDFYNTASKENPNLNEQAMPKNPTNVKAEKVETKKGNFFSRLKGSFSKIMKNITNGVKKIPGGKATIIFIGALALAGVGQLLDNNFSNNKETSKAKLNNISNSETASIPKSQETSSPKEPNTALETEAREIENEIHQAEVEFEATISKGGCMWKLVKEHLRNKNNGEDPTDTEIANTLNKLMDESKIEIVNTNNETRKAEWFNEEKTHIHIQIDEKVRFLA